MKEEISVKVSQARKAYQDADDNGKKLLESLFGKDALKPQDITERIKTFEDAMIELGENHPLVKAYHNIDADDEDTEAYGKLRIIVAALNEGWKPDFSKDEWRYTPWFYRYTQKEYDALSESDKAKCVLFGGNANYGAHCGFASAYSANAPSPTTAHFGSRLCLKSSSLARYCGSQFADIWARFYL